MEIVEWSSVSNGVTIYAGGYVTHWGTIYICVLKHTKDGKDTEPGLCGLWERGSPHE